MKQKRKGRFDMKKNDKIKCIFCRPFSRKDKENYPKWIADLQVSTALIETNQICRGYTDLIYNKGHKTELFQLSKKEQIAFMEDLVKVAKAINNAFHPVKMNYELLGNTVPHLHWHIIPRKKSDPIELHWPIWGKDYHKVNLSDNEYRKIVSRIRKYLL